MIKSRTLAKLWFTSIVLLIAFFVMATAALAIMNDAKNPTDSLSFGVILLLGGAMLSVAGAAACICIAVGYTYNATKQAAGTERD